MSAHRGSRSTFATISSAFVSFTREHAGVSLPVVYSTMPDELRPVLRAAVAGAREIVGDATPSRLGKLLAIDGQRIKLRCDPLDVVVRSGAVASATRAVAR